MFNVFLQTGAKVVTSGQEGSMWSSLIMLAVFFGVFYFIAIRPQKKREKEHAALVDSAGIGDSVLTSSGFYGVIIDVTEEVVIVEFGNNKNCRIPMQKAAIVQIEKPGQGDE